MVELRIGERGNNIWFSYKENDMPKQGGWLFNESSRNKTYVLGEVIKIIEENGIK